MRRLNCTTCNKVIAWYPGFLVSDSDPVYCNKCAIPLLQKAADEAITMARQDKE